MDKLGKVIRGLECIRDWSQFAVDRGWIDARASEKMVKYAEDALELLKAQEPRVMTFEEAAALGRNTVVWYEFNGENSPRPRIVHHADKAGIQFTDGGVWHFVRDEYGKLFRLWTSRPTEAEREEIPWN
ncbi:MAG: hypothetical protein J6W84_03365 [Bacteroidales bacterium]|nr:hypothetical protein [Bacteroidales bacterium]